MIFGMKSRVHPKYKTKYRVGNWPEYERALVQRGDITLWLSIDAIAACKPAPSGRRGGQRKFSDHAIETALTLRLVFGLPLRQAEGFLRSILFVMGVDLDTPDHTTLSRRSQHLEVEFHRVPANGPIHLIVDATGLSIIGEGEWAAVKHGGRGRRGWKKLHLGVNGSGAIVAYVLTTGSQRIRGDRRVRADQRECRRRADWSDADRWGRRRHLERHCRRRLRYGRDLPGGGCAWRHGHRSTDDNGGRVAAETTGEPSRPHDPKDEADRTPPLEAAVRLPSTSARGERLLSVQVDHW